MMVSANRRRAAANNEEDMIRLCLLLMALTGACVLAQAKPQQKVVLVMLRGAAEAQVIRLASKPVSKP
jgi:hypothetical protein